MAVLTGTKRDYVLSTVVLLAVTLLLCVQGYAQVAGATVLGTVTDPSGAVVPNAQVSITNTATGITADVTTNSAGFYTAPNLIPGPYQVTVRAEGFQTEIQSGITLTVGERQVINTALPLGQTAQTIEVSGQAASVELSSSAISEVVNSSTVVELPLNGRDWTLLAALQPSVNTIETEQPVTSNPSRTSRGDGNMLTISGTRPQANNYRIDGVSVNDYSGQGPGSASGFLMGVDAVAEFSVITSNYSAEYGRTSGGVINAITRSGADSFHGSAFGFLRSAALDARGFFDTSAPPPFHRSQYGGSIGGPIIKQKTFFFVSAEAFRQGQGITNVDKVPNATARTGLIHLAPPFPSNCVSAGIASDPTACQVTVDPVVAQYLKFWPSPNGPAIGPDTSIFDAVVDNAIHDNFITGRVDHHFSSKDTLSGTYIFDNAFNDEPDALNTVVTGALSTRTTVALEETHVFSPSLTNAARFGYSRSGAISGQPVQILNPLADVPNLGPFGLPASEVAVAGLTTFTGGKGAITPSNYKYNSFQGYDDAFLVRGNHLIKFGVNVERDQDNIQTETTPNGDWTFPDLYAFLTNQPTGFRGEVTGEVGKELRQTIVGAYIQDDWKIRPSLTLNLGLRYEMATVPTEHHNELPDLINLTDPTISIGAPLFNNPTLRNFEPRVGFAWDPFHNGKTAVRGAFGMFDVLPLTEEFYTQISEGAPFSEVISLGNVLPPGAFPYGLNSESTPAQSLLQSDWVQHNPKRNYVMVWNLNVQRKLTSTTSVTLGYVGNHGVHMYNREDDVNYVQPTSTPLGGGLIWPAVEGTLINPAIGDVRGSYWGGTAYYDALEASFSKALGHGLQAQASYTWGKGIDTGSAVTIGDPFTNSISSPYYQWPGRKGLTDYNIQNTFVLNYIWDIPTPKDWGGAKSNLLGGWEVGGIFTAESGQPFTPTISGDPLGTLSADAWAYPNLTPGCNATNPGNPRNYINLTCFTLPTVPLADAAMCIPDSFSKAAAPAPSGQVYCQNLIGNEGRNSVIGPGFFNLDFSIFKNNRIKLISENFNVQFRAEFFNGLNHAAFATPVTNSAFFSSSGAPIAGAGQINALAVPAREIQFGMKVIW